MGNEDIRVSIYHGNFIDLHHYITELNIGCPKSRFFFCSELLYNCRVTLGESDLGKVIMGQGEVLTLLLAKVNIIT